MDSSPISKWYTKLWHFKWVTTHWLKKINNCVNFKSRNQNFYLSKFYFLCESASNHFKRSWRRRGHWSISHPLICDGGSSDQQVDSSPCEGWLRPSANSLAGVDDEWLTRSTHFQRAKVSGVTELCSLARVLFSWSIKPVVWIECNESLHRSKQSQRCSGKKAAQCPQFLF